MSSVSDITNTTNGIPGSPAVGKGSKLGKDEFMKLLMTQLQAQDPLNPMDSTAFVAQLSQFATLEQQTNMSKQLDDLIAISGANNSANSVSLLGKEVRLSGNKIQGPGSIFYELASPASNVQIDIRDESGHVVKTLTQDEAGNALKGTTGLHQVKITDLPAGKYVVRVEAKDQLGKSIDSTISIGDVVSGVNFMGNIPNLLLASGNEMPASQLIEIRQPKGN